MVLKFVIIFVAIVISVSAQDKLDPEYWNSKAMDALDVKKVMTLKKDLTAKNVIIFVGSGMSASTITAARHLKGGENETFSFESYPWSGHARTYCTDSQTPDSACAATAFLSGVKSNVGTINVSPKVRRGECTVSAVNKIESIAKWALDAKKVIGFATTNRVTAGSAPALYASIAEKNWESNQDVLDGGCSATDINDIAYQLIHGPIGKEFKVILGGGRKNFYPTTVPDVDGGMGLRTDGKDLVQEWMDSKGDARTTFITKGSELGALNTTNIDYLLGLFSYDQFKFNNELTDTDDQPRIIQMTHYSLEMLQKKEHSNGFVLFVEDSLINEAHKKNLIRKALNQVTEYDSALGMAKMMASESSTLVLSLSDVGSTLSISGYGNIGSDLMDAAGVSDIDAKSYLKVSYATGPTHNEFYSPAGRLDPVTVVQGQEEKIQSCSAAVPMTEGVNGGEDILIHAIGPYSYLFSGSYEQNFIAHGIKYAACFDDYCSGSHNLKASLMIVIVTFVLRFIRF